MKWKKYVYGGIAGLLSITIYVIIFTHSGNAQDVANADKQYGGSSVIGVGVGYAVYRYYKSQEPKKLL